MKKDHRSRRHARRPPAGSPGPFGSPVRLSSAFSTLFSIVAFFPSSAFAVQAGAELPWLHDLTAGLRADLQDLIVVDWLYELAVNLKIALLTLFIAFLLLFGLLLSHAEKIGLPMRFVLRNKLSLGDVLGAQRDHRESETQEPQPLHVVETLCHELRNPLNSVMGFSHLLRRSPLNETQRDYVDALHQAAQTTVAVLNATLDNYKVDAEDIILENKPFSPIDEVEAVIKQCYDLTRHGRLNLIFTAAADAAPIRGDPLRFRQIVFNLVSNAVKFTQKGGVEVDLNVMHRMSQYSPAGAALRMSVADTGIGISEADRQMLFKRFRGSEKIQGRGIGLAICKQLVDAMGGEIFCSSAPGSGSRFEVNLPFAAPSPHPGGTPPNAAPLRGKRVLVVSGDPLTLKGFERQLRHLGGAVVPAHGCLEAIGLTTAAGGVGNVCDGVVIAGDLKSSDGVTLAVRLREDKTKAGIPIIVAAQDRSAAAMAAFTPYCDGFLPAPPVAGDMIRLFTRVFAAEAEAEAEAAENRPPPPAEGDSQAVHDRRERGDMASACRFAKNFRPAPLRVLLVDDKPTNVKLVEAALGAVGHFVDGAGDGMEGVKAVNRSFYDVILMDIEMPICNGIVAASLIRGRGDEKSLIPIIALSGHGGERSRKYYLTRGFNDRLGKPIDPEKLLAEVEKWGYGDRRNLENGGAETGSG